jgi:enediyne biosynthesis protein E4
VTVEAGSLRMIDEVMSGGSYYSNHSFTLHFGLGIAAQADRIEVRWPSGRIQEWREINSNRTITITEGEALVRGNQSAGARTVGGGSSGAAARR